MSVKDELDREAKQGPALLLGGTCLLLVLAILGITFALNALGLEGVLL